LGAILIQTTIVNQLGVHFEASEAIRKLVLRGAGEMAQQVRSTDCSSRGPRFNSQHPHGNSYLSNSRSRASDTLRQTDRQAKRQRERKIKTNEKQKEKNRWKRKADFPKSSSDFHTCAEHTLHKNTAHTQ